MHRNPGPTLHPSELPDGALIDTVQLAGWLGCSCTHLERQRHFGKGVPYLCLAGGRVRYRVIDVRAYLAEQPLRRGTYEYPTHVKPGPGRPRGNASKGAA